MSRYMYIHSSMISIVPIPFQNLFDDMIECIDIQIFSQFHDTLISIIPIPFQNSDMFWKPTIAIQGDVASFITEVSKGLKGYKCDPEWTQKLLDRDCDKEKANK